MAPEHSEVGYRGREMGLAGPGGSCQHQPAGGTLGKPHRGHLRPPERRRLYVVGATRRIEGVEGQALQDAQVAVMAQAVEWPDAPRRPLTIARDDPAEVRRSYRRVEAQPSCVVTDFTPVFGVSDCRVRAAVGGTSG